MSKLKNKGGILPFSFRLGPVSVLSAFAYASIFYYSIYVHNVVPAPVESEVPASVSLDDAWRQLQTISKNFHPFNSRENDDLRAFLLSEVEETIKSNNASYEVIKSHDISTHKDAPIVTVYDDLISNMAVAHTPLIATYFEGTNIIVRIKGSGALDSGAVLVNAHYDSVSTGYGATDDGMGCVTIIQLLRHFTTPGNQPHRDVILLLNNGEEDHLHGAYAFLSHPVSRLARTFVNLEGAGAGGRALLFRSSDYEVTKMYAGVPHPLGTVITKDGFERGAVRSQTDYVVFHDQFGLRGLDIAFFGPRSQYHTSHDTTQSTSPGSVWHMLSAALETTSQLANDHSSTFDGPDFKNGRVDSGHGSPAVWWDILGRNFIILKLQTVLIWSGVFLGLSLISLLVLHVRLVQTGRWYLFDEQKQPIDIGDNGQLDGLQTFANPADEAGPSNATADIPPVFHFRGSRGFWRTPICLILSCAALYGITTTIVQQKPYLVYTHPHVVWALMLSTVFVTLWSTFGIAYHFRPSALVRVYSLLWLFSLSWVLLLANTAASISIGIAGGYPIVILFVSLTVATYISYAEFFSLASKERFILYLPALFRNPHGAADTIPHFPSSNRINISRLTSPTIQASPLEGPNETTPLNVDYNLVRPVAVPDPKLMAERNKYDVYGQEQLWSGTLPKWTWLLQFIALVPVNVAVLSNLGLVLTTAIHQTPADGSPNMAPYKLVALVSVLLIIPLVPFVHRISYHLPALLSLVFIGLTIFSSVSEPFDNNSQLVVRFLQTIDLDTGINSVQIRGLDGYVQSVVSSLPSALSKQVTCETPSVGGSLVASLKDCTWPGLPPRLLDSSDTVSNYRDHLRLNARLVTSQSSAFEEAIFELYGNNTRGCRLLFDQPIAEFSVLTKHFDFSRPGPLSDDPSAFEHEDYHFATPGLPEGVSSDGLKEVRLWSRDWESGWAVKIRWRKTNEQFQSRPSQELFADNDKQLDPLAAKFSGRAVCLWSNQNDGATIPALSELRAYMPAWSTVVKTDDGLVNGEKRFYLS